MKKIFFTLIIATLGVSLQAQNTAMAKFSQLCEDCNTGKADYPTAGCRAMDYLCDGIQADASIAFEKEEDVVSSVNFAYEHDGATLYGITAKVEFVDKKGKVVSTYDNGDIYVMSDDSRIVRMFGTKTTDFMARQLTNTEAVLFSFKTGTKVNKKSKMKAKVTILSMDKNTRTLVEIATFEERI